MNEIKEHKRVNDILLGPLERPALSWLAAHLPAWVSPNTCTIIGVIGAFVIMVSYAFSSLDRGFLWLASLGFLINWFGDSLDGTLARHRHIERPVFGFFVDHTVDAFNEVMIFLGLGLTPYINLNVAFLILVAYLLLSILVYVRTSVVGEFKISYSKLGPTEFRVLAILLNMGMYFGGVRTSSVALGAFGRHTFSIYDLIVAALALLLLYFFFVTAIKEAIRLSKSGQ
jgi:archaetidylinositol phosphate synthase